MAVARPPLMRILAGWYFSWLVKIIRDIRWICLSVSFPFFSLFRALVGFIDDQGPSLTEFYYSILKS
jgi:hypothetical protein